MRKILTIEEWRRRKKRNRVALITFAVILLFAILTLIIFLFRDWINNNSRANHGIIRDMKESILGYNNEGIEAIDGTLSNGVVIQSDYLTPNEYSRPQTPLKGIHSIVIHYTGNPGTTAANNRSYFEGLAKKRTTYASSHYVIGLEGEIIQCIPLTEIAFASNFRNSDTVAIENCHADETGKFSEATYDSLVALTAALCTEFKLGEEDIIRHYDVTQKRCPKYYVENEEEWLQFKADVLAEVENIESSQNITE